ncbi:hypothetical protein DUNSADRAFT_18008 [Dunaliella salina]|uniref:Uncharacterized protein n=1 Tax=Dunaliella salina TaxID=3046 RepID=A0ABQ7G0U7_DUNSA|nr:hypothetical protein DUNSADRAFT_18008 [Dunaliella salina]|eukprot:KAF5828227.1 hypothetical protein DUNSADRAFT_18008 [Dunaliella salina]
MLTLCFSVHTCFQNSSSCTAAGVSASCLALSASQSASSIFSLYCLLASAPPHPCKFWHFFISLCLACSFCIYLCLQFRQFFPYAFFHLPGGLHVTQCLQIPELFSHTFFHLLCSFRTTLCLQFPAETIAYGALYMAHRLNLQVFPNSSLEILLKEKTQDRNMTFFKFFEIRPEDIAEVERQITSVYKQSKLATIRQQQQLQEQQQQQQQLLDPAVQGQAVLPFNQQQYQSVLHQTQQSPLFFSPSPGYTPTHASMPTTPGNPSPTEPFPGQHQP